MNVANEFSFALISAGVFSVLVIYITLLTELLFGKNMLFVIRKKTPFEFNQTAIDKKVYVIYNFT